MDYSPGRGREWLGSLELEPVDCYLRIMETLKQEINMLNRELKKMARDDPDINSYDHSRDRILHSPPR